MTSGTGATRAPDVRDRLAGIGPAPGFFARRRMALTPLAEARLVVLDLETTGPHLDRDRIVAIGAVAVVGAALSHRDAYLAVPRQAQATAADNILVHRIGAQRQLDGEDPADALLGWLEYQRGAPTVAFRAEFDRKVLEREYRQVLGVRRPAPMLDLAQLLPELFPGTLHDSLDAWAEHFHLTALDRHDAIGDAYLTAQLLLVALAAARRAGARTVGDLAALEHTQRWMGRHR